MQIWILAAAAGFGGLEDLKANPWSGGTNGSKIELPLFGRRPDEGAARELRKVDFKSAICILLCSTRSISVSYSTNTHQLSSDFGAGAKQI